MQFLFAAAGFVLFSSVAVAAADDSVVNVQQFEQRIAVLHEGLKESGDNSAQLQSLYDQANALVIELQKCARDNQAVVLKTGNDLNSLGKPLSNEAALIHNERLELQKQQAGAQNLLASCKVLLDDSVGIANDIQERSRHLIRQRLMVHGTDMLNLTRENLMATSPWLHYFAIIEAQYQGLQALGAINLFLLFAPVLVAILCGFLIRRWLNRWGGTRTDNEFTSVLLQSIKLCLAIYIPFLLATATASIFFMLLPADMSGGIKIWAYLSYSLTGYLAFSLAVRILLNPPGQLPSATFLPKKIALGMARRLQVLVLLSLAGLIYFASQDVLELSAHARLFGRGIFLTLFVLNVLWFVWLIGRLPSFQRTSKNLRVLLTIALVTAVVAEWMGYRGLSSFLLRGTVGTLVLVSVTWVLYLVFSDLFDGLDRGKHHWQRYLRDSVGLADGARFPGLSTLRFLTALALWIGSALLFLKLWGVSDSFFLQLLSGFKTGFEVAGMHIVPSRIVIGLILFSLMLQVSSRLRGRFEKQWLPNTGMDRGAREATATIFGYVGFLVAILFGLSAAGLDLSKLAIIAGALSVGIGFGLQNIVNNFISGLILLFERPIVPGDYVTVGNTEGFVRKISIRSTEIETLDRRTVIVPNADLISGQVVNWMKHDSYGRVKLDVGVSYGSDLKKVQQILLDIISSHPEVVQDGNLVPLVNLTAFGENAVIFTVTVVVRNFAQRSAVASDVNFAIDEAFRRNGILIPYAQKILQVQQLPSSGQPPKP